MEFVNDLPACWWFSLGTLVSSTKKTDYGINVAYNLIFTTNINDSSILITII
jgi:hypothetical protein